RYVIMLYTYYLSFPFSVHGAYLDLPSFPTRRSSDLCRGGLVSLRRFIPQSTVLRALPDHGVDNAKCIIAHAERAMAHWSLLEHRSEEHTSELQSHLNLVCRLLLEQKNNYIHIHHEQ